MIANLPPAFILIGGAVLIPLFRGSAKKAWLIIIPVLALATVHVIPEGRHFSAAFLGQELVFGQMDRLARVFGYVFSLAALLGMIFALGVDDDLQHVSALAYAGGALGVVFSGDFFSLYVFWEIMALASTFLVLARRTRESQGAAFRYVLVHLAGGLLLLAGILIRLKTQGTLRVEALELRGTANWLIFIGIAVNAAVFPLHPWLKDAYPQATPTGAVFLSAFTTKSAVYLMARTFAGSEVLIWLGAIMTMVPIFYAVLENDIRGVLSYSLINQVGFMLCGVGIGTQLALNGTVSHAFCHILYKALLFMAAGSVLQVTGRIRCTDLGGLYKTMPLTCLFCCVGAASISAFPLFSGFVSKSMIVSAAGHGHLVAVWLMLQFASAGVFHHAGIKVPYFIFFGHDAGLKAQDPPKNMTLAMGAAAFLCVFLGVYPKPLYDILPFPVDYVPYTGAHVVGQLQLLMFGALAFTLLMLSGVYPAEIRAINLDTDWWYRKGAKWVYRIADRSLNGISAWSERVLVQGLAHNAALWSRNLPIRTAQVLTLPLFRLLGYRKDFLRLKAQDVQRHVINSSAPVGLAAALAVAYLLIVFGLS